MFLFSPLLEIPLLFAIILMLYGNYKECKLLVKISTKLDKLLEAQGIQAMDIIIKRAHFKWNKPRLIRLVDRQLDLGLGANNNPMKFRKRLPWINTLSSELAYRRLLKKLIFLIRNNNLQTISPTRRQYRSQILLISPVLLEIDKKLDTLMRYFLT